ncbi:hypothetical protein ACIBG8_08350 [Nonomuraea sp. NPDC050556]|uniref:hypothetical protein n=1 Tax=Nonomuraea sp. NPDC050556 TaxID=3364369 RepID=UPI0037B8E7A1
MAMSPVWWRRQTLPRPTAFINYLYDIALIDLTAKDDVVSWEWIHARGVSPLTPVQVLKHAPYAWREWIKDGNSALPRVRRRMARSRISKASDQRPVTGSPDAADLEAVHRRFDGRKHDFEAVAATVAARVLHGSGQRYVEGRLTRRSGDGGADFAGRLDLGSGLAGISLVTEAAARGEGLGLYFTDRATALLHLGLGHYAEAAAAARRAATGELGPFTAQALPDLIEAAVRSGATAVAASALVRLEGYTAGSDLEWAAGLRAQLGDGEEADRCYAEAVDQFELARTRLLYGEWLRRERRRSDARGQLKQAFEEFASMGADGFAERARHRTSAPARSSGTCARSSPSSASPHARNSGDRPKGARPEYSEGDGSELDGDVGRCPGASAHQRHPGGSGDHGTLSGRGRAG